MSIAKDLQEPSLEKLKQRWLDSGKTDYQLLCLAIGKQPHQPPVWAMQACIKLYFTSMKRSTTGQNKDWIGDVLDDIMRVYLAHNEMEDERLKDLSFNDRWEQLRVPSFQELATIVLTDGKRKYETDTHKLDAAIRMVRRAWDEEAATAGNPDDWNEKGIPETPRYKRMVNEWGDKHYNDPLSRYSHIMYWADVVSRKLQ